MEAGPTGLGPGHLHRTMPAPAAWDLPPHQPRTPAPGAWIGLSIVAVKPGGQDHASPALGVTWGLAPSQKRYATA